MNIVIQTYRSIPLIAAGIFFFYEPTKSLDGDSMFDGLLLMVFKPIMVVTILLWTFNKNIKEFTKTKSKLSFLPIVIGMGCPLIIYYIPSIEENPSILFAGYDGGFNGAFIDLKADGTYQISNSGGIGSNNFYGQYQIQDSIIILDKSNIDKVIESNKLVIRPNLDAFLPEEDTLLYQLDEDGRIKREATVFTVHTDRRQK